jgi:hypothetical protein
MASRPVPQEDPEAYRAWALNQEMQKELYSIPPLSNENIDQNVAEIGALLSINSEILERIHPMMVGSLAKSTKFRRLDFSDVVYLTDHDNVDNLSDGDGDDDELMNVDDDFLQNGVAESAIIVCRAYPTKLVWQTFDTAILFGLSDDLSRHPIYPMCGTVKRKVDGTIDFESLMQRAETLKDEALLPLLIAIKSQLFSIQQCLGEIEGWIIQPCSNMRRIFGEDLNCLQLRYMAKVLLTPFPCNCHRGRHLIHDNCDCELCLKPMSKHKKNMECPKTEHPATVTFHCNQDVPFVLWKKAFKLKVKGQWNHQFDISSDDDVEEFQKFWNFL